MSSTFMYISPCFTAQNLSRVAMYYTLTTSFTTLYSLITIKIDCVLWYRFWDMEAQIFHKWIWYILLLYSKYYASYCNRIIYRCNFYWQLGSLCFRQVQIVIYINFRILQHLDSLIYTQAWHTNLIKNNIFFLCIILNFWR